jgi:hypothetical protein
LDKINKQIENLKENKQDFEWYPTTREMIEIVYKDLSKDTKYGFFWDNFSLMDIGAGDGNVFKIIEELRNKDIEDDKEWHIERKYAIEKSDILIQQLSEEIIVVGTDFYQQSLIDKKTDIVFCNPPYSEYQAWTTKIIREANCDYIYLIIPVRWRNNKEIKKAIKDRISVFDGEYEILETLDFINSEYRKARAKVDIVKIRLKSRSRDPFEVWFDRFFKINADSIEHTETEYKEKQKKINDIISKGEFVKELVKLYDNDLQKLLKTFKSLENIDYNIMKELGVNIENVKKSLQERIAGLKNFYWKELFDKLDKIKNRLTSKSRDRLMSVLLRNVNIDFTEKNIYAILIWIIKNANRYLDNQIKEMYFEMTEKDNVIAYKSNIHFIKDKWRYNQQKEMRNYKLDYRLVFQRYNNFNSDKFGDYQYPNGLYKDTHEFINDICTIGYNLGFERIDSSFNFQWKPGKEKEFYYHKNGKTEIFMKVRCYKNGNVHCKFNKEFIKKLNIRMAKLCGWIKNEAEARKELELSQDDIDKYYYEKPKYFEIKSKIKLLE